MVIADLTTLNPNAFYEIGIRHTIQKPIIHVHLEGQRIPFDIAPFRSVKFSRKRPADIRAARQQLLLFIKEALNPEHEIDNPVPFSRGKIKFDESATPKEAIIEQQLEAMFNRLTSLEANQHNDRSRKAVVDALLRKSAGAREDIIRIKVSARSLQSARQLYEDVEALAAACFHRNSFKLGHQMESDVEMYVSDDGGTADAIQTFVEMIKAKGYYVDLQIPPRSGSLF